MLKSPGSDPLNGQDKRNARLYLTGLTASLLGDSAMTLVAGIWVKSLTGSNSAAALVSVGIYAPSLLAPVAGLVADRVRRRRLVLASNVAMAAVMLTLLGVDRASRVWLIYAVMTCYGAALALIDPAENALFAIMLDDDARARLNGLRMTLQEGCKLIAPLAGAGLFVAIGGGWVAALDAATFGVAAVAVAMLRVHDPRPRPSEQHWRAQLSAGARHAWQVRQLRTVVGTAAIAVFVSGIAFVAMYAMADALHRSPAFLGVFASVYGCGAIIGGLASTRVMRRWDERRLAGLGMVNGTVGYLLLATPWLPLALAGSFVRGFALPWAVVAAYTLAQRLTPANLQGRVAAALSFAVFATQPLAQALGAMLIGYADYRLLYAGVAAVGLACAAVLWRGTGR
jgi:MFS family permease